MCTAVRRLTAREALEILLSRQTVEAGGPRASRGCASSSGVRASAASHRGGCPERSEHGLISPTRAGLTYGAAFIGGAVLFFLTFAAIFNGSWVLLLLFLLCYAEAGALAVRGGGVAPEPFALALVSPAVPWVLWLFPASIPEAGVLRALLWPGLVLLMDGLAWLGGRLGPHFTSRRPDGI